MEHLGVLQDVLSVVDEELAGHDDDDGLRTGSGRLRIEREQSVNDLAERQALLVSGRSGAATLWASTKRVSRSLAAHSTLEQQRDR